MWNVELVCDRGFRQIFSDNFLYHNNSKRVPKKVLSTSRRRVVKNILGQVLIHYRTATSLKIFVGRQDHTVNALLWNLTKNNLWNCKLYCNSRYNTTVCIFTRFFSFEKKITIRDYTVSQEQLFLFKSTLRAQKLTDFQNFFTGWWLMLWRLFFNYNKT